MDTFVRIEIRDDVSDAKNREIADKASRKMKDLAFKFDYFKERIGLSTLEPDKIQSTMLDSPFDYSKQVLFLIPSFFPDPRAADYRNSLKEFLEQLSKEQHPSQNVPTCYFEEPM